MIDEGWYGYEHLEKTAITISLVETLGKIDHSTCFCIIPDRVAEAEGVTAW